MSRVVAHLVMCTERSRENPDQCISTFLPPFLRSAERAPATLCPLYRLISEGSNEKSYHRICLLRDLCHQLCLRSESPLVLQNPAQMLTPLAGSLPRAANEKAGLPVNVYLPVTCYKPSALLGPLHRPSHLVPRTILYTNIVSH